MFPPGTQITRDGLGKCGLFPKRTLSSNTSNKPELPASGLLAYAEGILYNVGSLVIISNRAVQHLTDCTGRKLYQVTRARCRVVCQPPV